MKKMLSFLILAPCMGFGQAVHFENGLSWPQVLGKAKTENKYIFVVCYAAGNMASQRMDRDVFSPDSVGKMINDQFVSLKVQLDTSKSDNNEVKAWYAKAVEFRTTYRITDLPVLLFFSPDGTIEHEVVGYRNAAAFMQQARDARDPARQYFSLFRRYQAGERDFSQIRYLLNFARQLSGVDSASIMARNYLKGYLDKLSPGALATRENLGIMGQLAGDLDPKEKAFQFLFHHQVQADSVMQDKNFATRIVDYVVTRNAINPPIAEARKDGITPDWDKISRRIERQFGATYVEKNVVGAKVEYYKSVQDWKNYTKYLVIQIDMVGLQNLPGGLVGSVFLNNCAWDVFQYSTNVQELKTAVTWIDRSMELDARTTPGHLDTKANLLYKLGKKEDAVKLEMEAAQLAPGLKDISDALQKMRQGEPTWVTR